MSVVVRLLFVLVFCFTFFGCATLTEPTLKAPPGPFVYNRKAYAHPALALNFGNRFIVPYTRQRPYQYMTYDQRRDTKHYIDSWLQCESGTFGFAIQGLKFGRAGQYCNQIMSIYIKLYAEGFPWGSSLSHILKEKPFSNLAKTFRNCADIGKGTMAFIDEDGRGVFYCETPDGQPPQ